MQKLFTGHFIYNERAVNIVLQGKGRKLVAPNRIRRRFNTYIPSSEKSQQITEFKYYEVDLSV